MNQNNLAYILTLALLISLNSPTSVCAKKDFSLSHQSGDPSMVNAYLEAALANEHQNYFALTNIGMAYARLENYSKSQAYLNQAIKLDKDNPVAYGYLGAVHNSMFEPNRAIPLLEKAIDLGTNDPIVFRTLMGSYFSTRQYSKAIQMGEIVLMDNPGDFRVELLLGRCYEYNNQINKAKEIFARIKQHFLDRDDLETAFRIQDRYLTPMSDD